MMALISPFFCFDTPFYFYNYIVTNYAHLFLYAKHNINKYRIKENLSNSACNLVRYTR